MNHYAESYADDIAENIDNLKEEDCSEEEIEDRIQDDRDFVREFNIVLSAAKKFLENLETINEIMRT